MSLHGRAATIAIACLAAGCLTRTADLEPIHGRKTSAFADAADNGIGFEEVTEDAGIDHTSSSWGTAWGDFDGDGLPDLYESSHGGGSVLYLNQGDGAFVEDSEAILGSPNRFGDLHGAAWADFDNDGDQDLFQMVGAMRGRGAGGQRLFVNDRNKRRLVNRADSFGISNPLARGRSPLWLDFDDDGLLDLFLGVGDRPEARATFFRNIGGRFVAASELTGVELDGEVSYAQIAHLFAPDRPNVIIKGFQYPRMVVSRLQTPFAALDVSPLANSAADTAIADIDGDLRPDIAVARARYGAPDVQLRSPTQLEAYLRVSSREIGFDFHTDGDLRVWVYPFGGVWWNPSDILVGNAGYSVTGMPLELGSGDPETLGLVPYRKEQKALRIGYDNDRSNWSVRVAAPSFDGVTLIIESDSPIAGIERVGFKSFQADLTNEILWNREGGFEPSVQDAGLDEINNCGSVVAADFDNDMDVDLYFACFASVGNLPNALFENVGNGTFRAVVGAGGASGSLEGRGDAAATADYDRDGFVDLSLSNGQGQIPISRRGSLQLFRNKGNKNHWLEVDLVGSVSNRDGVGAQVWVTAGGLTQVREQDGGVHRGAQNHQRLHFGLGHNHEAERVLVRWPSGLVQQLTEVTSDQVLRVVESKASEILGAVVVPRSSACVGEPVTFTSILSKPVESHVTEWNFGDGSPAVPDRSPRHIYSAAGTFRVGLAIRDTDGRAARENTVIRVAPRDKCGG